MIQVTDLTKKFRDITAVSSLSFEVKKGEIFGIVGPDGAGKSTLLRVMAGILRPDRGAVEIDGKDVYHDPAAVKENLAYMPQRFGLYEDLTVEENIYFFGKLFGLGRRDIGERVPVLYEFSRLGPFRDRLAGKLSGGMKQKLGLACSLVHSPGVILLDEPTNGVDPVSRREFWKILYGLLSRGVTIVVSTAYLDEAERCNRVALMHDGAFITLGSPAEVKKGMSRSLLEITSSDAWGTESALRESGRYGIVIREGDSLKVFVDRPGEERKRIAAMMKKKGISPVTTRLRVPTLENCFMEIVSGGGVQ